MRRAGMASAPRSIVIATTDGAVVTSTVTTRPPFVLLAAAALLTARIGFPTFRPPTSARRFVVAASTTTTTTPARCFAVAPTGAGGSRPRCYCTASASASLRTLSTLSLLVSAGGGRPNPLLLILPMMKGARALSTNVPPPTSLPDSNHKVEPILVQQLQTVSPRLQLRIVDETDSTQDEARRLLKELSTAPAALERGSDVEDPTCPQQSPLGAGAYAVMAKTQSRGRGTQGRTWEAGGGGNLFLTVCLPLDVIPVRITLLPLQVAVLVVQLVHGIVSPHDDGNNNENSTWKRRTTVKWPNDVLVDNHKISGTLIENEIVSGDVWLLIGIGINVESAPVLDASSPGKHGRPTISLRDAVGSSNDVHLPSALELGTDLASKLVDWAYLVDDDGHIEQSTHSTQTRAIREAKVIQDWKEFAVWGTRYELRGQSVEDESSPTFRGETVTTLNIEPDGQLLVADATGTERRLVADYLF